ncbi:MAG: AAA family ATPase [Candidatus Magasanikbacteria bacterium]
MSSLFWNNVPLLGLLIIITVLFLAIHKNKNNAGAKTYAPSSTPMLNSFSIDFTALARIKKIDPVIGRDDEIRKLTQVLIRRNKNNAILVGSPGVGKTAIVEGFAVQVAENNVPDILKNKRVISLEVSKLLSDTKYRGEFEKRIRKILEEIEKANRSIILFIDEIHSIVQSHGTEGSVNFADILKPALARGELQMIGATTTDEYAKYILTNPSLERRFQPVEIQEPDVKETLKILQGIKDKYRTYHKVEFTDTALIVAAELSHKLIKTRTLPDKAIDAIDEAAAMIKVSHVHESIVPILYQAAVEAHPEVAQIWKEIQAIDTGLQKTPESKKKQLLKKREALENELQKKGVITVDSDDVKKVILDWTRGHSTT